MTKQINIYDPIHNKVYTLDFEEIRFWLNIKQFQRQFKQIPELNNAFHTLDGMHKEYILKFLDYHDVDNEIPIVNWSGIPGFNVAFELRVNHSQNAASFRDRIQQSVKDKAFFEKKIFSQRNMSYVQIQGQTLPIESDFLMSNHFMEVHTLKPYERYPVYESYIGNGTDFDDKFLLNYLGEVEPIDFEIPLYEEDDWVYSIRAVITPLENHEDTLWLNVPNSKVIYEFFQSKGYTEYREGISTVYFEHEEEGSVIEFSLPPVHLYPPFISIRQHQNSLELKVRRELGMTLMQELKETGIWDEIVNYRGYLLEADALLKVQNRNKVHADKLLSQAIMEYDKIEGTLKGVSQLEAIFCAWLKNRIATFVNDKAVKKRSAENILLRYAELHMWEDFLWFLDHIVLEEKEIVYAAIREHLPIQELDKYYMMSKETYTRILEYWDKSTYRIKKPDKNVLSNWYYNLALQSYDIGLKETARHNLVMFFKTTHRNPENSVWAIEGTEELLEFAIKVGARKEYRKFAETMAKYMAKKRKQMGIGDMSAIGRKEFRYSLLTNTLSEARWAFHAGFILKKENKEKKELIRKHFIAASEAMHEAFMHYDSTESYTVAQTVTIGKGFVTAYHLGFNMKNEEYMYYILDLARELWSKNQSKELYEALHGIFQKEERMVMADKVINDWISNIRKETGKFELDMEKVIILSDLYLSVEEWDNCAKTILHGLEKMDWDFDSLNKIFITFYELQKYAPDHAYAAEGKMYEWINYFIQEKHTLIPYAKGVRSRIKKINDLK